MNAILLAGGQSSRFKSDKAMAKLDGQRLINRILCRLQEVFNRVYIIVNDKSNYSFLEGAQLVTDIIPDKGPLGGLYTGLQHSTAEYNYLAACDMPLITVDYLNFLKNIERDYDVLLPEYKDRLEPLAGIYTKSCLPSIEEQISSNNLKIKSFFSEIQLELISEELVRQIGMPKSLFANINYRNDLEKLNLFLGGSKIEFN